MQVPNRIEIVRVANGFVVEMPRPFKRDIDAPEMGKAFMESVVPALKDVMRMRDQDPLLASLREDPDDTDEETPEKVHDLEPMGIDVYMHVFATWDGVLNFLTNLIL